MSIRSLDLALLQGLDRRLERGTLVLAGPENNPARGLRELNRAARLGPLAYDELPALVAPSALVLAGGLPSGDRILVSPLDTPVEGMEVRTGGAPADTAAIAAGAGAP